MARETRFFSREAVRQAAVRLERVELLLPTAALLEARRSATRQAGPHQAAKKDGALAAIDVASECRNFVILCIQISATTLLFYLLKHEKKLTKAYYI